MPQALATTFADLTGARAMIRPGLVRARRLEMLATAKECRTHVRNLRHAIACDPLGANGRGDYDAQWDEWITLGELLDDARGEWQQAIWAMNWSYHYATRAECIATHTSRPVIQQAA
ncbi:MAG: hypothetical protein GY788_04695 [bacterium]|nr:hypothetical protein [bacterium]